VKGRNEAFSIAISILSTIASKGGSASSKINKAMDFLGKINREKV